ncbi:MAG TPA: NAD(P)H-hydrate dehydratase, partial [Phycisphaerales bacterium]|nr:NAD(P)H-hydrate dehydratase [Phycisphaerales bacterium]
MAGSIRRLRKVPTLPLRARAAHKGDFGRVLVVGGSRGMIGAPALAANAALRGGAGLCTVAAPETVQLAVAALCPCATSIPLDCDGQGAPAATAVRQVLAGAAKADVLAVGPGMDRGEPQKTLLRALLEQTRPIVLDADGLNNLADIDGWPERRRCPLVLTPHPG